MDVFAGASYKTVLRERVRELRQQGRPVTLKRVAATTRIQYTYLSRVLRSDEMHLGEDPLFAICECLDLFPEEIEYLLNLRAWEVATHARRKAYLRERLDRMRQARQLRANVQEFSHRDLYQQMSYLFDPCAVVLYVGLAIPRFRESPHLMGAALGLSRAQVEAALLKLAQLGFIELASNRKVLGIREGAFHYGSDHPLMRVHQNLLRQLSSIQLMRLPEDRKRSFMTTFSGDAATFERIKERFQIFLKEVEQLAQSSTDEQALQMNFDLFSWF